MLCLKTLLYFDTNLIQVWSHRPKWQLVFTVSSICLTPNRRHALTWTNSDPVHWSICASPDLNEVWYDTCSACFCAQYSAHIHDDVIKWKYFTRNWPFVRGIHRSPVNSPHKGQWRGALMLFFICVWINGWVNNREAGDLRRYRAHCDVTVMCSPTADRQYISESMSKSYCFWWCKS